MAKKIIGFIKLQIPAGKANPSPPVGPALGQRGLNIMEFCKAFNAQTQGMEPGLPVPVVITAFADKSFTFVMKTPPAAVLIRKAIGIEKGSGTPNTAKVGKISRKQLEEIAKLKSALADKTLENDFFRSALQKIEEHRQTRIGHGGRASTRSSARGSKSKAN